MRAVRIGRVADIEASLAGRIRPLAGQVFSLNCFEPARHPGDALWTREVIRVRAPRRGLKKVGWQSWAAVVPSDELP